MSWARMNEVLGFDPTDLLTEEDEIYYSFSSDEDSVKGKSLYSDEESASSCSSSSLSSSEEGKGEDLEGEGEGTFALSAKHLLSVMGIDEDKERDTKPKQLDHTVSFYKPLTPRTREKRMNLKKLNRTLSTRMEKISPRMRETQEYENLGINEIVSMLENIGSAELNFDDLIHVSDIIETKLKPKFPDMSERALFDMNVLDTLHKFVRTHLQNQGQLKISFYLNCRYT